jgi:hypothetical protein
VEAISKGAGLQQLTAQVAPFDMLLHYAPLPPESIHPYLKFKFKEAQHGPNPPLDLVKEIDFLVNRIVELDAQILNLEKTLRD